MFGNMVDVIGKMDTVEVTTMLVQPVAIKGIYTPVCFTTDRVVLFLKRDIVRSLEDPKRLP